MTPRTVGRRRPIVVVLGMHRSGTSLCSHVLSALGIDMADEIAPHESNAKGHWERRRLVDLHDRVLDHFNRGFYTAYHDFSLPVAWWADPQVGEVRREVVGYLTARMGEAPFGFKDPRTARLMPMWHQIFSELALEPKIVVCLRNPAQVARSLQARDRFDPDFGELRWFAYVIDLFRYTRNYDICVIEYEAWFDDPATNLTKLRNFVGLPGLERELDTDALLSEIVDAELRHDDPQRREARQPLIRSVYGLARRADRDPAARAQILTIAAQYVSFEQLQRGFQLAFERSTELAQRLPALEQDAAALRVALEQRDAALAAATQQAQQGAARETAALAEVDRQRELIADLTRQRDAAQLAAAEEARAEIARLRDALAAAERDAGERGAEVERVGRDLAELREALAGAEQRLAEERQAATERDATAAANIAELAARVAERDAEAAAHAAREVAVGAELDAQRQLIGELTRQRDAAQLAAAEAVQKEISELREAAAAADRRAGELEAALGELTGQRDAAQLAAGAAQDEAARLREVAAAADRRAGELEAALGEATRQRDAAQLAAAEAVQDEVARLRAALATAEGAVRERAAELDDSRRELTGLREALADRERLAAELAAAAERETAVAESIADLTARMAERAAEAAARENAAQAEIDEQRQLIGELRRQRDAAQLAAAEAVRAEVARLREAVAAAEREVVASSERLADEIRMAGERDAAAAATIADLAARLTARTADVETAGARESAALVELDKQRALAGELARQRDMAQSAAAAAQGEVARLCEALAASQREAHERATKIDGTTAAVIADLTARLAERARTAAQAEAELQARLRERAADLAGALALRNGLGLPSRIARRVRRHRVGAAIRAGGRASKARNWAAAARHYRRALLGAPDLPAIWVQLGHALKEKGDHAGAEAAYRQSLVLDPAIADTHLQLGHLLKLRGRWADAAEAYVQALELDPGLVDAGRELDALSPRLVAEGDRARDARSWALAARHYRRALDRQPELTAIWVQLGHALKEQGDLAAAEATYRRALALDGSIADTHLQLGHLLTLTARHAEAIDAYATAVRLDPQLTAARDALAALVGGAPAETGGRATAPEARAAVEIAPPASVAVDALPAADANGALLAEACERAGTGRDMIWLGVIDWHFRIQRPQHLATSLADAGARVFYVSLVFEPPGGDGRFRIVESPHAGVFEIRMRIAGNEGENLYRGLSPDAVGELQQGLDELIAVTDIHAPIVVVEHPNWHDVACGVAGATVVYDCLDLATGFSNVAETTVSSEAAMLADADLVIAASRPLTEHITRHRASSVLIRNAAEVEFFAQGYSDRPPGERPVVGYFGAIAEWFNIEWIEHAAAARPNWDFRLVGRTDGCDVTRAAALPNVRFLGERPYKELPLFLRDVDVAVIPFRMVDLIKCTNPVKLYEYMAAGKAVVAAPMPEVIEATDLAYIAEDANSFVEQIEQALSEDNAGLRLRRLTWARQHTWAGRAGELAQAIDASFPLVSIIILTYNNWAFSNACISSVLRWSDYPNLEIIVVDNASTDETRERLRELERREERIRVVFNDVNLGFAGGNNVGLRMARGDYLILLNNDTFVTRGWVRDLIRPMQLDARIGLTGPLTNAIGNEQKVAIAYRDMQEMQEYARRLTRGRMRRTFEAGNLAFFCVAIRRSVVEQIGLLDETYGIGFFEDDDYCRRARQANHKLVIADDVFVHHHLSASFKTLGAQAGELMERNRAIFEQRWGTWQPHRYRDEPGFG